MISVPFYQTVYIPTHDIDGCVHRITLSNTWYYKTRKNNIFIRIRRHRRDMLKDFICNQMDIHCDYILHDLMKIIPRDIKKSILCRPVQLTMCGLWKLYSFKYETHQFQQNHIKSWVKNEYDFTKLVNSPF